jgi:hypothetical protein
MNRVATRDGCLPSRPSVLGMTSGRAGCSSSSTLSHRRSVILNIFDCCEFNRLFDTRRRCRLPCRLRRPSLRHAPVEARDYASPIADANNTQFVCTLPVSERSFFERLAHIHIMNNQFKLSSAQHEPAAFDCPPAATCENENTTRMFVFDQDGTRATNTDSR